MVYAHMVTWRSLIICFFTIWWMAVFIDIHTWLHSVYHFYMSKYWWIFINKGAHLFCLFCFSFCFNLNIFKKYFPYFHSFSTDFFFNTFPEPQNIFISHSPIFFPHFSNFLNFSASFPTTPILCRPPLRSVAELDYGISFKKGDTRKKYLLTK